MDTPAVQEPAATTAAAIGLLLTSMGMTVGGAESVTAGRIASRLAAAPDASTWFRGSLVAYSSEVKHRLLDVPDGPVISESCVRAMAGEARRLLDCDVAFATSGVGGPDQVEGQPPGTVWVAVAGPDGAFTRRYRFRGAPDEVVERAARQTLSLVRDWLREHLGTGAQETAHRRRPTG